MHGYIVALHIIAGSDTFRAEKLRVNVFYPKQVSYYSMVSWIEFLKQAAIKISWNIIFEIFIFKNTKSSYTKFYK